MPRNRDEESSFVFSQLADAYFKTEIQFIISNDPHVPYNTLNQLRSRMSPEELRLTESMSHHAKVEAFADHFADNDAFNRHLNFLKLARLAPKP